MDTGVTSVTFRKLEPGRIISLASRAGLAGIEWGGDIHAPQGDEGTARAVRRGTEAAGLRVLSYGSYHALCEGGAEAFRPVLASALALGAPAVRIWAGRLGPEEADEAYVRAAAGELQALCGMARPHGVDVCLEYHRNTLTATCESAARLIGLAACENLKTYWQPNPDISHGENCRELAAVLPWLHSVHTFHWGPGGVRLSLARGRGEWLDYAGIAKRAGARPAFILEFVRDDDPDAFLEDAAELISIVNS